MNPRYPIYIISKGRWETPLTARALDRMNVPYRMVVEPLEYERYCETIKPERLIQLPFDNLGQGSIPARNFVWDHSTKEGHKRHWILDDNIRGFMRFNRNVILHSRTGATFAAAEDFTDRFANVPMSGMNYFMFVKRKHPNQKVCTPNTRVYSCILLSNEFDFRWRGRYNEDTDLSLRVLKAGYCTLLFNAFLADKVNTMTMKGGNSDKLYEQNVEFDGRLAMARALERQHPDVVKVSRLWGRWQHKVDYRPFRGNQFKLKRPIEGSGKLNEYGMTIKKEGTSSDAS